MQNLCTTVLLLLVSNTLLGQWDILTVESYNNRPEKFWMEELYHHRSEYMGIRRIAVFSPDDNSDTLTIELTSKGRIKNFYGVNGDTTFVSERCIRSFDCDCFNFYGQMDSVICDSSGRILRHFNGGSLDESWEYDSLGSVMSHYIFSAPIEAIPVTWKIAYKKDKYQRDSAILFYSSLEKMSNGIQGATKLKQYKLQGVNRLYYTKSSRIKNDVFFKVEDDNLIKLKQTNFIYKSGRLALLARYNVDNGKYPFRNKVIYK